MIRYEKGSKWRRWDLHIHTPGTNKEDQFDGNTPEDKWKKYLKSVEEYPEDIAVIGVTDYFGVENYFKMKAHFEAGEIKCGVKCLIPNVEIRCSPVTGKGNALNLHVLFDPDIDEEIEGRFLNHLYFNYQDRNYAATTSELIQLGRKFKGDPNYPAAGARKLGLEQFVVPFEKVRALFKADPELRKHCLIVLANGNDGASGIRNHVEFLDKTRTSALEATVNSIYSIADAIFSGVPNDRMFFLGQKNDTLNEKEIRRRYKTLMPCLHGCDAHANAKIFEPDEKRYCWIKADPTFSGLRQVIYEPELRVHIGELAPQLPAQRQTIQQVKMSGFNGAANDVVNFSPNLTCIIGGRSTGKSVLLATVAKKLLPGEKSKHRNKTYNEFVAGVADQCDVLWADGEVNSAREIEYFYQGYMEKYQRSQDAFDGLVKNIVTKGLTSDPILEFENFISSNKQSIQEKLTELSRLRDKQAEKLREQKAAGDVTGIKNEIKRIEDQLETVRKSQQFSEDQFAEYSRLDGQLKKSTLRQSQIATDRTRVDALFAPEVKSPDISDLSTETRDVLAAAILKAKESVQLIWRTALKKIDDAEVIELEKLSAVIDTVEANPTYLKGVEIIQKNEALKALESTLADQRGALSIFNRVTEEITRLADRDSELRREILELNFKYYTEAERLSANLTSTLSGGEVVIEAYPRILLEGYNNRLQYAINLQSYDRKDEATFTPGLDEKQSFKEQLADKFTKALANELKLKNQYSAFRFLQDIIAECHVSISYRVTYEGDEYETMSEGKQAYTATQMA
jgi:hypothetical protein